MHWERNGSSRMIRLMARQPAVLALLVPTPQNKRTPVEIRLINHSPGSSLLPHIVRHSGIRD